MSPLPDYDNRRALVESYGWNMGGWPGNPTLDAKVLVWRWENARGKIIPAPPTVPTAREGIRQHVITDAGEHEVFLHLPYYGSIKEWGELLFDDMIERGLARPVVAK